MVDELILRTWNLKQAKFANLFHSLQTWDLRTLIKRNPFGHNLCPSGKVEIKRHTSFFIRNASSLTSTRYVLWKRKLCEKVDNGALISWKKDAQVSKIIHQSKLLCVLPFTAARIQAWQLLMKNSYFGFFLTYSEFRIIFWKKTNNFSKLTKYKYHKLVFIINSS